MSKPLPTDLEILNAIFDRYSDTYSEYVRGAAASGRSRNYLPIDIEALGAELQVGADVLFGRLYYDLDQRHGYVRPGSDSRVALFSPVVNEDRNCVQFPLLTAVLAGMRDEDRKNRTATRVAGGSLVISAVSLTVSSLLAWWLA